MSEACSGQRARASASMRGQLRFRHVGIVLERQRGDLPAVVVAAHAAGEGDDGADVGTACGQLLRLGGDVEILALHAHSHGLSLR